jgi:hypothetical protein
VFRLRMEAKLFRVQALDEPIDAFKRGLVGDGARQFPVSLCSVVDFNTAVMKINLSAGNPFGNGEAR